MLLRFFLIIGLVLLTTGCPRSTAVQMPITQVSHGSQQVRQVNDFTKVYVSGALNVSLHTGYKHPQIILHGDSRDLAYVSMSIASGMLRVSLGSGYPKFGAVQIEIDSRYLNSFEYHGTGIITGSQLRTGLLDVMLENPGKTTLQGQIGLRKLAIKGGGYTEISGINSPFMLVNISGKSTVKLAGIANITTLNMIKDGRLSLYWVKSRELTIRGRGKSFIQLAGIVDKLDVELWGSAHFNGRYLRAMRSFVKTHNQSVAEISAVKRQHTLARDTSDIHFYNIPVMKADFMANKGAVLDMRDLGLPFIQEYSQYNK